MRIISLAVAAALLGSVVAANAAPLGDATGPKGTVSAAKVAATSDDGMKTVHHKHRKHHKHHKRHKHPKHYKGQQTKGVTPKSAPKTGTGGGGY